MTGQLALVAYIPGPLGRFLDHLRSELVSGCNLQSHVTILPPRLLNFPEEELVADLESKAHATPTFEIRLGPIEVFPITNVIYISLATGKSDVENLHGKLCNSSFSSTETYPFHPHVTLAQEIPAEKVPEVLEKATSAWAAWTQEKSFPVEKLTFVRNENGSGWRTISEHELQSASLLKTA
jgi:2'-5' RNA ligase